MPRKSRPFNSYRWVYAWLGVSAVFALVLIANSVRDYIFVSRLITTQQVRRQMRQSLTSLEQQLRRSEKPGDSRVKLLLSDFERTGEKPLWLEVRTSNGAVLESYGSKPSKNFTPQQEVEAFRNHDPLYKLIKLAHGYAVVEAFALYVPPPITPGSPPPPLGLRNLLVVEIALPLTEGDPTLLKVQKWNLFISVSVANALLATVIFAGFTVRRYVRGRLLEQQVEIAREVQARLLPAKTAVLPGVHVATEYQPSDQVGGDLYDLFPTPEGKVALVIGDVSGKGIPAALLMGVIHGAVRTSRWTQSPELHLAECSSLNHLLCASASGERYATLFWCYYEPAERTLHYINAGHCPPFILTRKNGYPELLSLSEGGPVVGILPDAPYTRASLQLAPGDVLVMFSDGLAEATRADGEEFGEERLRSLLLSLREEDPDAIRTRILDAVRTFMGSATLHDDLTLVVAVFGDPKP